MAQQIILNYHSFDFIKSFNQLLGMGQQIILNCYLDFIHSFNHFLIMAQQIILNYH